MIRALFAFGVFLFFTGSQSGGVLAFFGGPGNFYRFGGPHHMRRDSMLLQAGRCSINATQESEVNFVTAFETSRLIARATLNLTRELRTSKISEDRSESSSSSTSSSSEASSSTSSSKSSSSSSEEEQTPSQFGRPPFFRHRRQRRPEFNQTQFEEFIDELQQRVEAEGPSTISNYTSSGAEQYIELFFDCLKRINVTALRPPFPRESQEN